MSDTVIRILALFALAFLVWSFVMFVYMLRDKRIEPMAKFGWGILFWFFWGITALVYYFKYHRHHSEA
jgi:hypothetical protein